MGIDVHIKADGTGNDANDGSTSANAVKTFNRVNSLISGISDYANIYIHGGTTGPAHYELFNSRLFQWESGATNAFGLRFDRGTTYGTTTPPPIVRLKFAGESHPAIINSLRRINNPAAFTQVGTTAVWKCTDPQGSTGANANVLTGNSLTNGAYGTPLGISAATALSGPAAGRGLTRVWLGSPIPENEIQEVGAAWKGVTWAGVGGQTWANFNVAGQAYTQLGESGMWTCASSTTTSGVDLYIFSPRGNPVSIYGEIWFCGGNQYALRSAATNMSLEIEQGIEIWGGADNCLLLDSNGTHDIRCGIHNFNLYKDGVRWSSPAGTVCRGTIIATIDPRILPQEWTAEDSTGATFRLTDSNHGILFDNTSDVDGVTIGGVVRSTCHGAVANSAPPATGKVHKNIRVLPSFIFDGSAWKYSRPWGFLGDPTNLYNWEFSGHIMGAATQSQFSGSGIIRRVKFMAPQRGIISRGTSTYLPPIWGKWGTEVTGKVGAGSPINFQANSSTLRAGDITLCECEVWDVVDAAMGIDDSSGTAQFPTGKIRIFDNLFVRSTRPAPMPDTYGNGQLFRLRTSTNARRDSWLGSVEWHNNTTEGFAAQTYMLQVGGTITYNNLLSSLPNSSQWASRPAGTTVPGDTVSS